MKFPIAAQDLLGFLRSQNDKFQIRSVYTPVRQKTMHVLNPHGLQEQPIHELGDDPRIAVCKCCPKSATSPCDSLACIIPHALVISSVNGLRLNEIFPPRRESNSDFAVAIAEARDMYGIDEM
uniref:Uncharacterized protein n=1 Tax=Globisporangium ultimum (strain ATCC 200006 / CBS 805.95 / DAOM BR144) TaxID=431595 RepID=K3WPW4_GLOUD